MENNFINKQLNRRSERNYDEKAIISPETISKLKEVAFSSPTSINGQTATAIFIQEDSTRQKFSQWNWGQKHVEDAPLFILFLADLNRLKYANEKVSEKEWKPADADFNELMISGAIDATIKAQAVADAALSLGLGTCFIGGVRTYPGKIIEEFNLPEYIIPIVGLTVGYIKTQEEIKPKLDITFDEKYNQEEIKSRVDAYDEIMREYSLNRKTNSKDINWSRNTVESHNYFFAKEMYKEQEELIKTKFEKKKI